VQYPSRFEDSIKRTEFTPLVSRSNDDKTLHVCQSILQYAIRYMCQNLKFGIYRGARYSEIPAQLLTLLTRIWKLQVHRCGGELTIHFSIYPLSLNIRYHSVSTLNTSRNWTYEGQPKNSGNLSTKKITVTPSFHRLLRGSTLGAVGNNAQGDYFEGDGS
jgi:hypothetical protein